MIDRTKRLTFANGITLLTHPLPGCRVVALHFCVKAGYFDETDEEVGLSHLLEHMYFKGSENFPQPGSLGVKIKDLGGIVNATTSYDQTRYFCCVPSAQFAEAFAIMSDALLRPLFPQDELQRECEVVVEEMHRKLDSPAAVSKEELIRLAFKDHRIRRWRIGTPEQLRSYDVSKLFDFHRRQYQPRNIVVTIAGDFDHHDAEQRVAEVFGSISSFDYSADTGPAEREQADLRYALIRSGAKQNFLHFGFHAPGVFRKDCLEIDFLTSFLSSGRSSPLRRFVVEQQRAASSIACGYHSYRDVGLFTIAAVTDEIRKTGRSIWTVLQDVLQSGIAEHEVTKIKTRLQLARRTMTQDALQMAELLSYYEAAGGYEKIDWWMEQLLQISGEQVQQVAAKYLQPHRLSVLEYVNSEIEELTIDQYVEHLRDSHAPPEILLSPPVIIIRTSLNGAIVTTPPSVRKGKIRYILQPDERFDFLACGLFFEGGRCEETAETAGLTNLLLRTCLKGTPKLNAGEIAMRFDSYGASPGMHCGRDFSAFTFQTIPDLFLENWKLLLTCLVQCNLPENEVEIERAKMMARLKKIQDDNFARPLQLFQRAFFGKHPYAIPESGFEESVPELRRPDLFTHKSRTFNSGRATAVFVGSFHPNKLFDCIEETLESLSSDFFHLEVPPIPHTPVSASHVETHNKKQTAVIVGFPAPAAGDAEIHRFEILQQILSGMGGRLFLNLRSKKSLAYSVYAGALSALHGGSFVTYIAGEAHKEAETIEELWKELEDLRSREVNESELQRAVNALTGGYIISNQTASARIFDYYGSVLLNRPLPFAPVYPEILKNISTRDIQETAGRTFRQEKSAIAIVRGTA